MTLWAGFDALGFENVGDLLQGLAGEHLTFDGQASTLIIIEQDAKADEFFDPTRFTSEPL